MIRYLKYAFLVLVALGLVVLALANREPVLLEVLPENLALWFGWSYAVELPLFLVIFGGVVLGLLVGFVWEWLREHRHRVEAKTQRRDKQRLEREVEGLKGRANEGKDDVLALLEDTGSSR
ncbi:MULTISPECIES: lipopolysaccharide assembly protein LapA domain-containing protein [Paracoccaceae]|uniref:lipopolysaccharide assembly protein LapA domain-containing protein n=1 Tax=Rhodobacterales TaxID=204455 RepID=UPI003369C5CD